jgi:hypothetical protein
VIDEIDAGPVPLAVLEVADGKPYISASAAVKLLAELRKPNGPKGGSR